MKLPGIWTPYPSTLCRLELFREPENKERWLVATIRVIVNAYDINIFQFKKTHNNITLAYQHSGKTLKARKDLPRLQSIALEKVPDTT